MKDLETALAQLKSIEPNQDWAAGAKQNLMDYLENEQEEVLVKAWFKNAHNLEPDAGFLVSARIRLMNQIHLQQQRLGGAFAGLRRLLASSLVILLAAVTTVFFSEGQTTVVADENATLEVLLGGVTIQEDLQWEKVMGWREIHEGDLLRTDANVDAVLHFHENQLRLGPNTVLLVTQFNADGELRFNVSQGSVWLQVPAQKEEKGFVAIETPNASVLTPNASVQVKVEPLGTSTTVQVFDGAARVTHINPNTQETKVEVMTGAQQLNVYGKKSSEGVRDLDVEAARQDPKIKTNLQRDALHKKHLEEVSLERLKNLLGE